MPELRPARFTIDGLGGAYDGFTTGADWNGWATPYFTLDVARRVAADYAAQGSEYLAEANSKGIRLYEPNNEEWDEFGPVEVNVRDSVKPLVLYPVGAFYWTWEEVTTAA